MKALKQVSKLGMTALMASVLMTGCVNQPSNPIAMSRMQTDAETNSYQQSPDHNREEVKQAQKVEVKTITENAKHQVQDYHVKKQKLDLIKITGIGYGSESTYEGYTPGQRRLMAIRASKLDAYRSLAEQINGIKIDSNTAISTLTAQSDSFRARVNAVVRGARVISITPMADHNYETVLEVYVDRDFFNNAFIYTGRRSEEQGSVISIGGLCANGGCH